MFTIHNLQKKVFCDFKVLFLTGIVFSAVGDNGLGFDKLIVKPDRFLLNLYNHALSIIAVSTHYIYCWLVAQYL